MSPSDTSGRPVRNWKLKFRQVWARRVKRHADAKRNTVPMGNREL